MTDCQVSNADVRRAIEFAREYYALELGDGVARSLLEDFMANRQESNVAIRANRIEVRDPETDTIPLDVYRDPDPDGAPAKPHWIVEQDDQGISITLDMARGIVAAIEMLESEVHQASARQECADRQLLGEAMQALIHMLDLHDRASRFEAEAVVADIKRRLKRSDKAGEADVR